MKRRLQVGAVLVVAALSYFTGIPPGFGGGSGGDGDAGSTAATVYTSVDVSKTPNDNADKIPPAVVRIVVENDGYSLKQNVNDSVEYQPTELDRLIELARKATGDDTGIRVVLTSRTTARPPAENLLKSKLLEAGLTEREIDGYSNLKIEGDTPQ